MNLHIASECQELDEKRCACTLGSAESALAPLAASDMSKIFYTTRLSASASQSSGLDCAGSGLACPPCSRKPAQALYHVTISGPEPCDAFRGDSAPRSWLGRWWGTIHSSRSCAFDSLRPEGREKLQTVITEVKLRYGLISHLLCGVITTGSFPP